MGYKNPKELLIASTALPVAIEAKLPEGAPKISQTILDMAEKLPKAPDFPMELPDLPAVPELPGAPDLGLGRRGLGNRRRLVTGVTVAPVGAPLPLAGAGGGSWKETPVAAAGVVGQGHTVRDYA